MPVHRSPLRSTASSAALVIRRRSSCSEVAEQRSTGARVKGLGAAALALGNVPSGQR
jgi:hypothetical protein